eukprot:gb/GECG01008594.1/.p1 GENE.gb/GECG01008594.1/~~gb/GECG01008594.1/.p1  ORF type:complete len:246 (+),score=27.32 gb/GECG01008594.1/:1-738(+)
MLLTATRGPWDKYFRDKVEKYYFGKLKTRWCGTKYGKAREHPVCCQLTGDLHSLRAAHLSPFCAPKFLLGMGLRKNDINNEKNALILAKRVEEMFDKKQLTFLWEFLGDTFYSVVMNRTDREANPDLHLKELSFFKAGRKPWRRVLVNHAKYAFQKRKHELEVVDGKVNVGKKDGKDFWLLLPSEYPDWPFDNYHDIATVISSSGRSGSAASASSGGDVAEEPNDTSKKFKDALQRKSGSAEERN